MIQEKGQSGGAESPKRGPLSPRKTDRLLDLWVLPGHLEPTIPSIIMPTCLHLFFEMMIFRNSIRNGTEFCYQWRNSHLMTSWKDCTNEENESLRNSGPYWICSIWRFTRRKLYLIITDWRQWWKEVPSRISELRILEARNAVIKNQGQNSVNEELQEIVGSGKPTGSVWKETIAVSGTIWISVQSRHRRILLRDLLRRRMWEMHREPKVLEAEAQVEECLDCLARITSKELAPIHSVQSGILQNACSTKWMQIWVKSALMRIARLKNRQAKGLKRMVTKVQWQNWKVHDNCVAYLRIWSRRSLHRFCGRAQTHGNQSDVFDSQKPSYVMLTFETKIHRFEWCSQVILISVTPMLQNLRIGLRRRQSGKSKVPAKQRRSWPKVSKN